MGTPDSLHQAAEVIYYETNRLHRLVLDLLSLARLEAGTAGLQRAPVDLVQLLQSVIEKFTLKATEARIDLRMERAQSHLLSATGIGWPRYLRTWSIMCSISPILIFTFTIIGSLDIISFALSPNTFSEY